MVVTLHFKTITQYKNCLNDVILAVLLIIFLEKRKNVKVNSFFFEKSYTFEVLKSKSVIIKH